MSNSIRPFYGSYPIQPSFLFPFLANYSFGVLFVCFNDYKKYGLRYTPLYKKKLYFMFFLSLQFTPTISWEQDPIYLLVKCNDKNCRF